MSEMDVLLHLWSECAVVQHTTSLLSQPPCCLSPTSPSIPSFASVVQVSPPRREFQSTFPSGSDSLHSKDAQEKTIPPSASVPVHLRVPSPCSHKLYTPITSGSFSDQQERSSESSSHRRSVRTRTSSEKPAIHPSISCCGNSLSSTVSTQKRLSVSSRLSNRDNNEDSSERRQSYLSPPLSHRGVSARSPTYASSSRHISFTRYDLSEKQRGSGFFYPESVELSAKDAKEEYWRERVRREKAVSETLLIAAHYLGRAKENMEQHIDALKPLLACPVGEVEEDEAGTVGTATKLLRRIAESWGELAPVLPSTRLSDYLSSRCDVSKAQEKEAPFLAARLLDLIEELYLLLSGEPATEEEEAVRLERLCRVLGEPVEMVQRVRSLMGASTAELLRENPAKLEEALQSLERVVPRPEFLLNPFHTPVGRNLISPPSPLFPQHTEETIASTVSIASRVAAGILSSMEISLLSPRKDRDRSGAVREESMVYMFSVLSYPVIRLKLPSHSSTSAQRLCEEELQNVSSHASAASPPAGSTLLFRQLPLALQGCTLATMPPPVSDSSSRRSSLEVARSPRCREVSPSKEPKFDCSRGLLCVLSSSPRKSEHRREKRMSPKNPRGCVQSCCCLEQPRSDEALERTRCAGSFSPRLCDSTRKPVDPAVVVGSSVDESTVLESMNVTATQMLGGSTYEELSRLRFFAPVNEKEVAGRDVAGLVEWYHRLREGLQSLPRSDSEPITTASAVEWLCGQMGLHEVAPIGPEGSGQAGEDLLAAVSRCAATPESPAHLVVLDTATGAFHGVDAYRWENSRSTQLCVFLVFRYVLRNVAQAAFESPLTQPALFLKGLASSGPPAAADPSCVPDSMGLPCRTASEDLVLPFHSSPHQPFISRLPLAVGTDAAHQGLLKPVGLTLPTGFQNMFNASNEPAQEEAMRESGEKSESCTVLRSFSSATPSESNAPESCWTTSSVKQNTSSAISVKPTQMLPSITPLIPDHSTGVESLDEVSLGRGSIPLSKPSSVEALFASLGDLSRTRAESGGIESSSHNGSGQISTVSAVAASRSVLEGMESAEIVSVASLTQELQDAPFGSLIRSSCAPIHCAASGEGSGILEPLSLLVHKALLCVVLRQVLAHEQQRFLRANPSLGTKGEASMVMFIHQCEMHLVVDLVPLEKAPSGEAEREAYRMKIEEYYREREKDKEIGKGQLFSESKKQSKVEGTVTSWSSESVRRSMIEPPPFPGNMPSEQDVSYSNMLLNSLTGSQPPDDASSSCTSLPLPEVWAVHVGETIEEKSVVHPKWYLNNQLRELLSKTSAVVVATGCGAATIAFPCLTQRQLDILKDEHSVGDPVAFANEHGILFAKQLVENPIHSVETPLSRENPAKNHGTTSDKAHQVLSPTKAKPFDVEEKPDDLPSTVPRTLLNVLGFAPLVTGPSQQSPVVTELGCEKMGKNHPCSPSTPTPSIKSLPVAFNQTDCSKKSKEDSNPENPPLSVAVPSSDAKLIRLPFSLAASPTVSSMINAAALESNTRLSSTGGKTSTLELPSGVNTVSSTSNAQAISFSAASVSTTYDLRRHDVLEGDAEASIIDFESLPQKYEDNLQRILFPDCRGIVLYSTPCVGFVQWLLSIGHGVTYMSDRGQVKGVLHCDLELYEFVFIEWSYEILSGDNLKLLFERIKENFSTPLFLCIIGPDVQQGQYSIPRPPLPPPTDTVHVFYGPALSDAILENRSFIRKEVRRGRILKDLHGESASVPFQTVRKIGSGGFGDVYEVVPYASKGRLAMKRIPIGTSTFEKMEMLYKEVAIMREMDHINVVQLAHVQCDKVFLFIFMELCEGTLEALLDADFFLKRNSADEDTASRGIVHSTSPSLEYDSSQRSGISALDKIDAMSVIHDVVSAVRYLHSFCIVHRDIKPQNILISNGVAKLADFGSATTVSGKQDPLHAMKGTLPYMAPEVFLGELYRKSCDVWSLGILIAEILGIRLAHTALLHFPALQEFYKSLSTDESMPVVATNYADSGLKVRFGENFVQRVLNILNEARDKARKERQEAVRCRTVQNQEGTRTVFLLRIIDDECDLEVLEYQMPASLVELLERTFHRSPEKRISADGILDHPIVKSKEWWNRMISSVTPLHSAIKVKSRAEDGNAIGERDMDLSMSLSDDGSGDDVL